MYRIAVIGDFESTLGFKALGFEVHDAPDPNAARTLLDMLSREGFAIIYLTEQLAQHLQADIQKYQTRFSPAIILIPGASGTLGIGQGQIRTLVEKAVGMDIFKEKSEVLP